MIRFFYSMMLLTIVSFFGSIAHAEIVETKFNVTGSYYNAEGLAKRLVRTRTFIRYDNNASLISQSAKDNCLISVGKKDIGTFWETPDTYACVSGKTYVITSSEALEAIFTNPTIYTLFSLTNLIDAVYDNIVFKGGEVTRQEKSDESEFEWIRAKSLKLFNSTTATQNISLIASSTFEFKGTQAEKMVITLEPVRTRALR